MEARGFKLAFERAKERLRGKIEPIEPEVEPKRLEKIEVVTMESVGVCGTHLRGKKECSGMPLALDAGLCERCGFYRKVRPTEPIEPEVKTATVGFKRAIESVKQGRWGPRTWHLPKASTGEG